MPCVLQVGYCQPSFRPGSGARLPEHSGQRPKGLSQLACGGVPCGWKLAEAILVSEKQTLEPLW